MAPPRKRLGEILIDAGLIDDFQLNTALNDQKRWGGKVGQHLIRLGFITEEKMLDALRNQLKIPSVNLQKVKVPENVLRMIPEALIRKHKALPVGVKTIGGKDHLIIAMADPSNLDGLDEMQFATKLKIMPALAGPITLDRALRYYFDKQGNLFMEDEESNPFSPVNIRSKMDITEGSPTFDDKTGQRLEPSTDADVLSIPPAPSFQKSSPTPALVDNPTLGQIDIAQLRAEVTALRDMLLEKEMIDRKGFVERVIKLKPKE